ncbi:MAG TPA: hypothetical protein PLS24_03995 [Sedimentisphaerales bacterium]|nr:hypothetical protein [Sedimentisphaerales bacterium]HOV77163.1 hypothetical protein [Sedimentisphaerales bacterium]HQI27422.1 hypothetical protein [Sedimentisphaerales bacterium]
MKSSNTIVTVVVIAAVLIAAYGVGLLIRQARLGNAPPTVMTDANSPDTASKVVRTEPAPGGGQTKDTPEIRAQIKERRAEMIEKMASATEEEKARFIEQVRTRVGGRRKTQPVKVQEPNSIQKTGADPNAVGRD